MFKFNQAQEMESYYYEDFPDAFPQPLTLTKGIVYEHVSGLFGQCLQ